MQRQAPEDKRHFYAAYPGPAKLIVERHVKKQRIIFALILMALLLNSCGVFFTFDVDADVPQVSVNFRNNTYETLLVYRGLYDSCPDIIQHGRLFTVTIRKGQTVYIYGADTGRRYVAQAFYSNGYYVIDGF